MQAGKYRHLITLEQRTVGAPDEFGARAVTWQARASVWASIAPVSLTRMSGAAEAIMAGSDNATDIYTIQIYAYPGIEPEGWRILYAGRRYDIKAVRPSNDDSITTLLAMVGNLDGL